jgi:hypothetical protein
MGSPVEPLTNRSYRTSAVVTRPNDTTQYAAGDVVSAAVGAAITFADASRFPSGHIGRGGTIVGATIVDSANQGTGADFRLYLFTSPPTVANDNAPFAPTDAQLNDCVAVLTLTAASHSFVVNTASGAAGNRIYELSAQARPFYLPDASTSLYGVLTVTNAYTPVAQETFTITLGIVRD